MLEKGVLWIVLGMGKPCWKWGCRVGNGEAVLQLRDAALGVGTPGWKWDAMLGGAVLGWG